MTRSARYGLEVVTHLAKDRVGALEGEHGLGQVGPAVAGKRALQPQHLGVDVKVILTPPCIFH